MARLSAAAVVACILGRAQPSSICNPAVLRRDRQQCAEATQTLWHRIAKQGVHVTCAKVGKTGDGPGDAASP